MNEGKECLSNLDFVCAHTKFITALGECPESEEANFFASLTLIAGLLDTPELKTLLDRFGVESHGRDILSWTAGVPRDIDGKIVFPSDSPKGGEVVEYLKTDLLPHVEVALASLDKVGNSFSSLITFKRDAELTEMEVDYGDAAFYRAGLLFVKSIINLISSYDLDLDIDDTVMQFRDGTFSCIADVLGNYVNLLQLMQPHSLREFGDSFEYS
ncbi:MAG: hypothetical protein D8M57_00405 [Candidatus Scalindua sp. AMX11]|nr:MAG: hypothetical protein DWQ00_18580 [Candidatus Scalindua sp.]RZV98925.1 MAG: hypothetical protein EX341_00505 [Candidatus Scalindua sp. SCAELEC01]TDE66883.1 MAG: hypothetical protein D8M57_00405 [Candidatus Scalindua sp. AMX11]GJQ57685.1 MAG: hypothetical protein SCALA701_04860 [Candidatus Scalindua sp.]